jgi:hypothetical protein
MEDDLQVALGQRSFQFVGCISWQVQGQKVIDSQVVISNI